MRFFSVNEYVDKDMPSPVLREAEIPRARDHLVRPRGPSRFRACAFGTHTRGSSTGQGNVAFPWPGGWPLPAAGGRRHIDPCRPTMPCSLQSHQKAKRNGLELLRVPLRFDLGSKRPSRRDGLVTVNRRLCPRFTSI